MTAQHLLIRGGDVIDGTGAPRRRADVRVRDGRIAEIGPDLTPDGEQIIDAAGAVVTPGLHRHPRPHRPAGLLGPAARPRSAARRHHDAGRQLQPLALPGLPETRGQISDLFAYIEDVPRHLFDDEVPWTWSNYDGYRDAVNAVGTGINLAALVGHSPLRLAVMGDDAWTRVGDAGRARADGRAVRGRHERRRLGAFHVVPGQRQGRPAGAVTRRRHGRVRRAFRRHPARRARPGGGRAGPARRQAGGAARGPRPALRRPRDPAHLDRIHLHRQQSGRHPAVDRPRPPARSPKASASTRSSRRAPSTSGSTGTRR